MQKWIPSSQIPSSPSVCPSAQYIQSGGAAPTSTVQSTLVKDEEIVLVLDGDDCLAHENVLKALNKAYADPDVWMTYGNYLDYPTLLKQEPCICKEIPQKVIAAGSFRSAEWDRLPPAHLLCLPLQKNPPCRSAL